MFLKPIMKEPVLFRRQDTLSHTEALYWKDLLYRTVKIGTELEFALPKGKRKADIMPALRESLEPSSRHGRCSLSLRSNKRIGALGAC